MGVLLLTACPAPKEKEAPIPVRALSPAEVHCLPSAADTDTFDRVFALPQRETTWLPLEVGVRIDCLHEIKTMPYSRVELRFDDVDRRPYSHDAIRMNMPPRVMAQFPDMKESSTKILGGRLHRPMAWTNDCETLTREELSRYSLCSARVVKLEGKAYQSLDPRVIERDCRRKENRDNGSVWHHVEDCYSPFATPP